MNLFTTLLRKYENWRVLSALKEYPLPFSRWQVVRQLACIRHLSPVEKARLHVLCSVLLTQKSFIGQQGLDLSDEMKLIIAAQACVPILKLGLNYYSGFVQVSVYPAAFWVEHEERDEAGIVHRKRKLLSGEAWSRGPLILSWDDIQRDIERGREGHNVIIHEFAHKIDMLNTGANGVPPISTDSRKKWTKTFQRAYQHLIGRMQHHHKTCINAYGGTSPTEFFAVSSEYFFTAPDLLERCYPNVYKELKLFYRQDPLGRLSKAE